MRHNTVTGYITDESKERLEFLAEASGRSVAQVVGSLLEAGIKNYEHGERTDVRRVRKDKESLLVNIPAKAAELAGVEMGDYLEVRVSPGTVQYRKIW